MNAHTSGASGSIVELESSFRAAEERITAQYEARKARIQSAYENCREQVGKNEIDQEKAYLKALKRGVDVRFIIQAGRSDGITGFLKDLSKKGASVRTIKNVPAKLAVIDDREVWMALLNPNYLDESFTALVIKHPSTAGMEKIFFQRLWDEGDEFR